jgi:hypothetical protein
MATRSIKAFASFAAPHACAIGGGLVGLLGGPFGLGAGVLLGAMLDIARLEARARARIASFLERPDSVSMDAALGYAAASCLALWGEWPGPRDGRVRRALWDRLSAEAFPPTASARREAERTAEVAARAAQADHPALERALATGETPLARRLLATWAYALAALGGGSLDSGDELGLRAALGDCGIGSAELLAARAAAFPGTRDPWSVLGLKPGASRSELKRAYRRLSRAFHPDARPGDDGARFRELGEAYAALETATRRQS